MQNLEFFVYYFCKNTFCHSVLPSNLNFADVTPVYKKNSKSSKENYPPISILSNVSIVYDRCLYDQMQNYFQFSYHFSIQEMYVFSSVLKTPCLKKKLSIKMLYSVTKRITATLFERLDNRITPKVLKCQNFGVFNYGARGIGLRDKGNAKILFLVFFAVCWCYFQ